MEDIDQINLESSEEEGEREKEAILIPPTVGEFLVLKRILHAVKGSIEGRKGSTSFTLGAPFKGI